MIWTLRRSSMPILAVLLVVIAAFTHASWNILAKRGGRRQRRRLVAAGLIVTGVLALALG